VKKHLKKIGGYSLVELIVSTAIASILGAAILLYTSTAVRMVSRNLATNHSHEAVRGSLERLLSDLHNASSVFTLVTYDGTTYSDVSPTVTTNQDAYSSQYVSNRANGVKYLRFAGGPYKLTGDGSGNTTVSTTATTLKFDFGPLVNGALPYIPSVGDKLQMPLINREFDITAVPTPPTASSTVGTVTIANGTGFTLYTVSGTTASGVTLTNPITTGYFYHRVGYTVWNNQLRFHPTYPPVAASDTSFVRHNITSPKPFALLFPTSSSTQTDNLNLRISLEAYDTNYSASLFQNGTTTLQAIIPSRTQPTTLITN
jgi:type II secretory pathway pseudopilin PulG